MKRNNNHDKLIAAIENSRSELEIIKDELQDKYDSKSEKWQEGEAGEKMQSDISELEEALNELESARDRLDNVFESE